MRKKSKTGWIVGALLLAALVLGAGTGGALAMALTGGWPFAKTGGAPSSGAPVSVSASTPAGANLLDEADLTGIVPRAYTAMPQPDEVRAMWISFLEWRNADLSTEAAARAAFAEMFDECAALGMNTVIAHVRAIGDAFYKSELFPYSHQLTGTQGQDPGYDPLAVMIEEAHARGLRFEAWVNPYRVKHALLGPETPSEGSPAAHHPEWVREVNGYAWLDPGIPEVRQLLMNGVLEIVQNYDVDGIHFDDYFYPEFSGDDAADTAFDAATYAEYGGGKALGEWRRGNINAMMAQSYAAVKAANPTASFGVSVQGNNDNNYNTMYADVRSWMASGGFVDYVMPQLYWGFGHQTQSGRTDYAFDNIAATWASYIRADGVKLYAGLAAYRIGMLQPDGTREDFGGNGHGDNAEWESGHAMADQVAHLRTVDGFSGFALFRHDFLFQPDDATSTAERQALAAVLAGT